MANTLSNYYVCDHCIIHYNFAGNSIMIDLWLEFGHYTSYHTSEIPKSHVLGSIQGAIIQYSPSSCPSFCES
jgi:hypothetical protein